MFFNLIKLEWKKVSDDGWAAVFRDSKRNMFLSLQCTRVLWSSVFVFYFPPSLCVCGVLQLVSGVSKDIRTYTHTQVYAGYCNLSVDLRWQDRSLHSSMGECTECSIHLRLSGSGRPAFFTLLAHDAFGALEECHWPECPDLSWGPWLPHHSDTHTDTHTYTVCTRVAWWLKRDHPANLTDLINATQNKRVRLRARLF